MKAEEHEAMTDLQSRTAQQVFDDHLRLSQQRAFDEDIRRNFSPDCVVLTGRGVFRGHDGLQTLARMLGDEVPTGQWEYRVRLVEGNAAYLEWSAHSEDAVVDDGADSFFIVDGHVVAQTIHYTVKNHEGRTIVGPDGRRNPGS